MATLGATLQEFSTPSGLITGVLKNCYIGWNGYMLGKTTEDTNLQYDNDTKDIIYSQDGTKAADHVMTGQNMILNATFAELKTSLVELLVFGVTREASGAESANLGFGRYTYTSLRDTKAQTLRAYASDSNGLPLTDDWDVLNCYKAIPLIQDNLINWGADTQTNLPVQFYIYYEPFDGSSYSQVFGGPPGGFGYIGVASEAKYPEANWVVPQGAPVLQSAATTDTDTVQLTFSASVSEQAGNDPASAVLFVDGVATVGAAISGAPGTTPSIDFTGVIISAGQELKLTVFNNVFEGTSPSVVWQGAVNYPVTNNVT